MELNYINNFLNVRFNEHYLQIYQQLTFYSKVKGDLLDTFYVLFYMYISLFIQAIIITFIDFSLHLSINYIKCIIDNVLLSQSHIDKVYIALYFPTATTNHVGRIRDNIWDETVQWSKMKLGAVNDWPGVSALWLVDAHSDHDPHASTHYTSYSLHCAVSSQMRNSLRGIKKSRKWTISALFVSGRIYLG